MPVADCAPSAIRPSGADSQRGKAFTAACGKLAEAKEVYEAAWSIEAD
jgi:hypothetical protein